MTARAATSDTLHVLIITPSADLPSAMRRYEHARDHASEVTALGWDLIAADLRMHRDTAGLPDYAEVRAEACDARAAALRAQEQQPPRTPAPSPSDPAPAWFALVTRPAVPPTAAMLTLIYAYAATATTPGFGLQLSGDDAGAALRAFATERGVALDSEPVTCESAGRTLRWTRLSVDLPSGASISASCDDDHDLLPAAAATDEGPL